MTNDGYVPSFPIPRAQAEFSPPPGLERDFAWTRKSMSNFDHSQDEGFEDDLRAGLRGHHAAWNFNGQVWYDPDAELFREEVWVHHVIAAERSARTLEELMRVVNDEFGWD